MLNESKVAEMAAYLLLKSNGRMSKLKLMKLLYLADRESMVRYALPISDDHMVSMTHGPVLSGTLDLMSFGNMPTAKTKKWSKLISAPANHELVLLGSFDPENDIDELSRADLEILDHVWSSFGHMAPFTLRDYTHENCGEWVDPDGSSFPINPKNVFMAIGDVPEIASMKSDLLVSRRQLSAFMSAMK